MVNPIQAIKLGIRTIADKGIGGKTVNPVYKNGGAAPISHVVVKPQGPRGAGQTGKDLDKLKKENFKPSAKYKEDYTNAMNRSR